MHDEFAAFPLVLMAAERLHHLTYHIEPHASSRVLVSRLPRRKAGQKAELLRSPTRNTRFRPHEQILFSALFADLFQIDAASVVADTDHDLSANIGKQACVTEPARGFPAFSRSSGCSIPWSMALRIRWRSGSRMPSAIFLSTSTFCPWTWKDTFFFSFLQMSRTILPNWGTTLENGTIRIDMTSSSSSFKKRPT